MFSAHTPTDSNSIFLYSVWKSNDSSPVHQEEANKLMQMNVCILDIMHYCSWTTSSDILFFFYDHMTQGTHQSHWRPKWSQTRCRFIGKPMPNTMEMKLQKSSLSKTKGKKDTWCINLYQMFNVKWSVSCSLLLELSPNFCYSFSMFGESLKLLGWILCFTSSAHGVDLSILCPPPGGPQNPPSVHYWRGRESRGREKISKIGIHHSFFVSSSLFSSHYKSIGVKPWNTYEENRFNLFLSLSIIILSKQNTKCTSFTTIFWTSYYNCSHYTLGTTWTSLQNSLSKCCSHTST